MEQSVIKMGVAYVGIHMSRYLKEELAWAIDKWLQVIRGGLNIISYILFHLGF